MSLQRANLLDIERPNKASAKAVEVNLFIASSLPANPHQHVAFRNSFFFDDNTNSLYLRKERLGEAGEFVLLLLHCLAHVCTKELEGSWDDRSPDFCRKYHALLR